MWQTDGRTNKRTDICPQHSLLHYTYASCNKYCQTFVMHITYWFNVQLKPVRPRKSTMQSTASKPAPELVHCCLYLKWIGLYMAKLPPKRFWHFRVLDLYLDQNVVVLRRHWQWTFWSFLAVNWTIAMEIWPKNNFAIFVSLTGQFIFRSPVLVMIHQCAKFESSSDRRGSKLEKVGNLTLPMPAYGAIYLSLASTSHDPPKY